MKTKILLTSLVCTALLSACGGGGGKLTDSTKSAALGACDPPSGPVGTKVVCEAKGMTEDSTLFFDGHPIEGAVNTADGLVAFTVPPVACDKTCDKKVSYREGASDEKTIDMFVLDTGTVAAGDDIAPSTGGTGTAGTTTGEDILPSTGGTGTTAGTTTGGTGGVADSDGDGVPDVSDSCPGTASGATVDANGCPPPAPPAAMAAKITVTPMFKTSNPDNGVTSANDKRIGLVKVDWSVTGGGDLTELYTFGAYYRVDADKSEPTPCGKISPDLYATNGKRYLLVDSGVSTPGNLGNDLNEGSTAYNEANKFMATAQQCTSGTNCHGYTAMREGAVTRRLAANYDLKNAIEQQPKVGLVKDAPYFTAYPDDPAICRMDLKATDGSFIRSGTFYTRILSQGQTLKLYAKTASEEASSTSSTVVADPVDLDVTAKITADNKVQVTATYTGAITKLTPSPAGGSPVEDVSQIKKGKGSYSATYAFEDGKKFSFIVKGIGIDNTATKNYKVTLSDADTITLKDFGNHTCKNTDGNPADFLDCDGTLSLQVTVAGAGYKIKDTDTDEVVAHGDTTVGVGDVKLYSNASDSNPVKTKSVGDGTVVFNDVVRDHKNYTWYAKVGSVKSGDTKSAITPYKAKFDVSGSSDYPTYDCRIQTGGGWDETCPNTCDKGSCSACPSNSVFNCSNHTTHDSFNFDARHLKEIHSTCGDGELSFPQGAPSNDNYQGTPGSWSHSNGGTSVDCTINATGYDGTSFSQHISWSWSDNCGC